MWIQPALMTMGEDLGALSKWRAKESNPKGIRLLNQERARIGSTRCGERVEKRERGNPILLEE